MIYSFFIKKTQGDIKPFDIVSILNNYLNSHNNLFLLGWPGYISTTSSTIDAFKAEISQNNKIVQGYFFDALNGSSTITHPITKNPITKIDYMNEIFGGYTCTHNSLKDHSKILAIIQFKKNILPKDITKLLQSEDYEVKALLVGSSNQSLNTYGNSPAPKGEADVFMLESPTLCIDKERELIGRLLDMPIVENKDKFDKKYVNNIIVTKEVDSVKVSSTLKQIVKKILNEVL